MDREDLFDHRISLAHKLRAQKRYVPGAAFLMERAAGDLAERLSVVERQFSHVVALHCLNDFAANAVLASGKANAVTRIESHVRLLDTDGNAAVAELESIPLMPASTDLLVTLLTLHEVNDTPGVLVQIRRALKPDGLFLGAMIGGNSLFELRDSLLAAEAAITGGATARVLPFADVRTMGGLLQRAGFALPVVDSDDLVVRYDDLYALLHDLRAMGATSILPGRDRLPASRQLFALAAQTYAQRHSDSDGRIRATFSMVWMSGWGPDQSQPKPLKPGSAHVSLARVLRT